MIASLTSTIQRFSPKFWVLMGSNFIDRLGTAMVLPFFALYLTQKFEVGMTQVGVLLGLFQLSGFIGRLIGGALADRFGRRGIVIVGMVTSALSSISFGLANQFWVFYVLAVVVGLPSKMAGPAYSTMIADILPEEQRSEGFGIQRVVINLAVMVGSLFGALLISYSYMLVFIFDATASLIVAGIFLRVMPETKPDSSVRKETEPLRVSFLGYIKVTKDWLFVTFTVAMIFSLFPYAQIYQTFPVFLRDVHGISERGFSYFITVDTILVVLAQFWVTSKISKRKPMRMLALASFFFMVGLVMYGFVSSYALFMLARLIITVGEMILMPVSQAMASRFAPEDMRGRYMAFFNIAFFLPSAIGPGAGGYIMDNFNPNWVWYWCGIISLVAIGIFLLLNRRVEHRIFVAATSAD